MLGNLLETAGGIGETAGNPIVFGIEVVASILGAIFGAIFGGPDVSALAAQIQDLASKTSAAISKVTRFAWLIANALAALLQLVHDTLVGFVSHIWDVVKKLAGLLDTLIHGLLADLVKLLAWLWKTAIPAILQAIQKLRALMQMYYNTYIRPILQYLQWVRRYLAILRAFHVHWAGVLDAKIARLESWITLPYRWVLQQVNGLANWINLILTAGLIIQRPVFLNTLYAYQRDIVNLLWWGQSAGQLPDALAPPYSAPIAPSLAEVAADFASFAQTGGGPYAKDASDAQAAFGGL